MTMFNIQDQPWGDARIYKNWKLSDSNKHCQAEKNKKLPEDKKVEKFIQLSSYILPIKLSYQKK